MNELGKILNIILPSEIVFKEDLGTAGLTQLRHGRLDDELYPNRNVINTKYGKCPFRTQIKMYFRAFTDLNSIITIDMYNYDDKNLYKKFIIKSSNNNFSISDMKNICNNIKTLLNDSSIENRAISLIEFIRTKEDLIFEEIA